MCLERDFAQQSRHCKQQPHKKCTHTPNRYFLFSLWNTGGAKMATPIESPMLVMLLALIVSNPLAFSLEIVCGGVCLLFSFVVVVCFFVCLCNFHYCARRTLHPCPCHRIHRGRDEQNEKQKRTFKFLLFIRHFIYRLSRAFCAAISRVPYAWNCCCLSWFFSHCVLLCPPSASFQMELVERVS